ncbi:hypothetical protein HK101_004987 [Irineochytrium annulatum]|nr:hypothetical protein HK101_004987 [Irineochytrium annulatum]
MEVVRILASVATGLAAMALVATPVGSDKNSAAAWGLAALAGICVPTACAVVEMTLELNLPVSPFWEEIGVGMGYLPLLIRATRHPNNIWLSTHGMLVFALVHMDAAILMANLTPWLGRTSLDRTLRQLANGDFWVLRMLGAE